MNERWSKNKDTYIYIYIYIITPPHVSKSNYRVGEINYKLIPAIFKKLTRINYTINNSAKIQLNIVKTIKALLDNQYFGLLQDKEDKILISSFKKWFKSQ